MDSPEPSKTPFRSASASTSLSSPVQESPFSNFVSSLSPIKHDKVPHVPQGLLRLNSPPLVFTSPRLNMFRRPQSSNLEASQNVEGDEKNIKRPGSPERPVAELQQGLITGMNEDDTKDSVSVQPSSSSGCVDEFLADTVEADSANSREEVLERKLTLDVKPGKTQEKQHADQRMSDECPNFESDMFDLSSQGKECKELVAQKVVGDTGYGCDGFLQLLPGSLQRVQAYEEFTENVEQVTDDPVHNETHDLEASEHQRGMSRRCLQFGQARPETTAKCGTSSNQANDMITSTSLATTSEAKDLGLSHVDLSATSRKRQLINLSQLAINMIPQCYSEKPSLTVSKPSGIGLHLNSIVNAKPMGQGAIARTKLGVDSTGKPEIKSASLMSCQLMENTESCSDAFEKVLDAPQDGTLQATACMISSSAATESISTMESLDYQMTLHTKRELSLERGESNEIFNQQSPKKKRKKSSNSTDGEGCKRCNCKKTKCLKLYCDCFAAGIYCAEPCSCQGCFNRPEYEDKVLETRQQIESRNPLAFAPKIVQPVHEFSVSSREDGNGKTPSSARHKRGCNCKRSMCLKKYCECYQANVGCSIGCRCEGCKNVFGKKEDYCMTEEIVNRGGMEMSESTVAAKKDFLHSELYEPHLTPLTPSFQCSDHGKNAPKSRLLSLRYLPSPESDLTVLSYAKSPKSPRTSESNNMLLERSKENLDVGTYCEGINYDNADMLTDECHQTPLPSHPSIIRGSLSAKARELTSLSRFQLGPRSDLSSGGSLRWRSSPVTPIASLDDPKNHQGLDSEGKLYDILEDDTPEILKDNSTPTNPVKVSSPNGKRVSPPHNLQQLGSSSSGPLRSGRKFILKAVPSFPPLTPCIDSKGGNQIKSKFQENSSND